MEHLRYQFKSLEKIPTKVWQDAREGSRHIAQSIGLAIRQKQQDGEQIVLGLATGSSPILIYQELVRMHFLALQRRVKEQQPRRSPAQSE